MEKEKAEGLSAEEEKAFAQEFKEKIMGVPRVSAAARAAQRQEKARNKGKKKKSRGKKKEPTGKDEIEEM
jgi:hypothetical protein